MLAGIFVCTSSYAWTFELGLVFLETPTEDSDDYDNDDDDDHGGGGGGDEGEGEQALHTFI